MRDGLIKFDGMAFEKCDEIFERTSPYELVDSTVRSDIHHFKVLELRTFQDTLKDDNPTLSQCKVRFHFTHPLIRARKSGKEEQKESAGSAVDAKSSE